VCWSPLRVLHAVPSTPEYVGRRFLPHSSPPNDAPPTGHKSPCSYTDPIAKAGSSRMHTRTSARAQCPPCHLAALGALSTFLPPVMTRVWSETTRVSSEINATTHDITPTNSYSYILECMAYRVIGVHQILVQQILLRYIIEAPMALLTLLIPLCTTCQHARLHLAIAHFTCALRICDNAHASSPI
jgi:hypothetical protein